MQNSRTLASPPPLNSANCAESGLADISRLVDKVVLVPRLRADTKIGAIKELVDRLHHEGAVSDSLRFLQAVLERDDLQSTVIGESIALPHARSSAVTRLGIAVGLAPEQISYPPMTATRFRRSSWWRYRRTPSTPICPFSAHWHPRWTAPQ